MATPAALAFIGAKPAAHPPSSAWDKIGTWDYYERIARLVTSKLPTFQAGISVAVKGGPDADIRRVWYLCLAAAFGRFRNRVVGTANTLGLTGEWDVTGKVCKVDIVYETSAVETLVTDGSTLGGIGAGALGGGAAGAATGVGVIPGAIIGGIVGGAVVRLRRGVIPLPAGPDPRRTPQEFIQRGPEQLTIGLDYPEFLRPPGGVRVTPDRFVSWRAAPCGFVAGGASVRVTDGRVIRFRDIFREFPVVNGAGLALRYPHATHAITDATGALAPFRTPWTTTTGRQTSLPDDGRVITTAERDDPRVQPPAPHIDGTSRSDLLAIVCQSLQSPCYLPDAPPCVPTSRGSGVQLYAQGARLDYPALATAVSGARDINTKAVPTNQPGVMGVDRGAIPNFGR